MWNSQIKLNILYRAPKPKRKTGDKPLTAKLQKTDDKLLINSEINNL